MIDRAGHNWEKTSSRHLAVSGGRLKADIKKLRSASPLTFSIFIIVGGLECS